jgi:hypothetical protein
MLQLLGGGLAWEMLLQSALEYGLAGWLVGGAFAATLIDFEARGILGRMKGWRIGLWGALMGGVLAPSIVFMTSGPPALQGAALAGLAGLGAALGSALSVGTHRLAAAVSRELAAGGAAGQLEVDSPEDSSTVERWPGEVPAPPNSAGSGL